MASQAWRIDSMDVRGGLAFAAFRPANLLDLASNLDVPCYALTAPDFRPEPLASRALALSGTRRGLQLGVWFDQQELSFASLDAVAEFVRRAYVATAGRGGDGGGETPGEVAPLAPEGPGPAEDLRDDFVRDLENILSLFISPPGKKGAAALIDAEASIWSKSSGRTASARSSRALLLHALHITLAEIGRRRVRPGHAGHGRWRNMVLTAFTLAVEFVDWDELQMVVKQYHALLHELADSSRHWRWFEYLLNGHLPPPFFGSHRDPIHTLKMLPVAHPLADKWGHREPKRASLFDGLQIMTAAPQAMFAPGKDVFDDSLALLFLSAAIIVRASSPNRIAVPWGDADLGGDVELIWEWLLTQLPVGPFPPQVEGLIGAVGRPQAAPRAPLARG